MVALLREKTSTENIREMGPALAILLAALIVSTFITEFTFTFGLTAAWKTLFRFLRLSVTLTVPLFLLSEELGIQIIGKAQSGSGLHFGRWGAPVASRI